jgi:hypothetical protein
MDKGETVISAGTVGVALGYRDDIPGDAGLCIQIYAEVDGQDTELLRFDCFANAPHYHYGPEQDNERLMLDATAAGDPLAWTLERFERGRLRPMIERAGYTRVAASLDEGAFQAALPTVSNKARAIVAQHAS